MKAAVGDRLHVHGKTVGCAERHGEIVEVKGAEGLPPYLVRFTDGHVGLVFPGPDAVVEPVVEQIAGTTLGPGGPGGGNAPRSNG